MLRPPRQARQPLSQVQGSGKERLGPPSWSSVSTFLLWDFSPKQSHMEINKLCACGI